jgi:hypothetical protein
LFLLLLVVGAIGLLYAIENWRGNRAWNEYRKAAEARGQILDWRTLWAGVPSSGQNPQAVTEKEDNKFGRRFEEALQLAAPQRTGGRQFEDLGSLAQACAALKSGKTVEALRREGFKPTSANTNAATRAQAAAVVLEAMEEDSP